MCGIVACYAIDDKAPQTKDVLNSQLEAALSTIAYRGPDSSGTFVTENGRAGIAHVRLSILDLAGGQQPLHDEENNIHAVVSGELYDYASIRSELEALGCQFKTNCDSELVVYLYKIYGLNLLPKLRGEFAFVLYDTKKDSLFVARDRFGIKPLYYTVYEGRLLLASEMKALIPMGWKAEWDVESIMYMGDYYDDRTVFKDVYKLPLAHMMTVRRTGKVTIQRYWDHEHTPPKILETRTPEEMIEGVRQRIIESVRLRLQSDVPVAVSLSGGIDSSAVAGIVSSLLKEKDPKARLATFTLSFPERGDLDEGPIARRMAEHIGAEIYMIEPKEQDLVAYYEKSVIHSEQPVLSFHGSGKIILSEHIRKEGYKVVLTGEGADEVFAGYSWLFLDYLRAQDSASANLGFPLPSDAERLGILKSIESAPPPQDHSSISDMTSSELREARAMLGGVNTHCALARSGAPTVMFSAKAVKKYGIPNHAKTIADGLPPQVREKALSGQWHSLQVAQYTAANILLSNLILNFAGECAEMANSVEGRPPFLDHTLSEYEANMQIPYPRTSIKHLDQGIYALNDSKLFLCDRSMKLRPRLQSSDSESDAVPRKWMFVEKWVLREAVKPFVTDELYKRKKSQYNAPIAAPPPSISAERVCTPLQAMIKERVTQDAVEQLGWAGWSFIAGLLEDYLSSPPATPADGGLDKRARLLLFILSGREVNLDMRNFITLAISATYHDPSLATIRLWKCVMFIQKYGIQAIKSYGRNDTNYKKNAFLFQTERNDTGDEMRQKREGKKNTEKIKRRLGKNQKEKEENYTDDDITLSQ